MPEGDTIHRTANVLRRALAGKVVTRFEIVAPRMSSEAARFEVVGSVVRSVESNVKHLLITFARGENDVVLHTHMKMTGAWHVYRPGERWWSPRSDARVVIRTDDFDGEEALRRLRASPEERDIATALLDQRTISGIGNVFKCEALFLERVSPWAKVAELDDATLGRLVAQARRLMRLNRGGGGRRTRFALNAAEGMWVDERTGLPCHVCGTPVAWGYHPSEFRKSWYCPLCQNVAWAPTTADALARLG